MSLSPEIWQMFGALAVSFIAMFCIYILPIMLLIACIVMLCLRRFARRRVLLLCICAGLILWILIAFASKLV